MRVTEAFAETDKNVTAQRRSNTDDVLSLIYAAIAEINLELPEEQRLEPSWDTALFGDGGNLDSQALANFIVITEQKFEEYFGFRIDLTEDDPFSPGTGHFKTAGSLTTYISSLVAR